MSKRRPVNSPFGEEIRWVLDSELPRPASSNLAPALSGDSDAAVSLCVTAPNEFRGLIAAAAYWLGTPNPGYQQIVRSVWNHDHAAFLAAADDDHRLVRRMMAAAQLPPPIRRNGPRLQGCFRCTGQSRGTRPVLDE